MKHRVGVIKCTLLHNIRYSQSCGSKLRERESDLCCIVECYRKREMKVSKLSFDAEKVVNNDECVG